MDAKMKEFKLILQIAILVGGTDEQAIDFAKKKAKCLGSNVEIVYLSEVNEEHIHDRVLINNL